MKLELLIKNFFHRRNTVVEIADYVEYDNNDEDLHNYATNSYQYPKIYLSTSFNNYITADIEEIDDVRPPAALILRDVPLCNFLLCDRIYRT